MKLGIIYAKSKNGVIGKDNKIPWSIPEDMKRFKELTNGCHVIMGRKTWESLPNKFKPLPNRTNIVLTNNENYSVPNDVLVCSSLEMALDYCKNIAQVWIIGGKNVYEQALPIADVVEETTVYLECEGDTFMSEFNSDWTVSAEHSIRSINNNTIVTFTSYKKPKVLTT